MGWSAKIVTACVVGGALLGATYDGLGLIDRWKSLKDAQTPASAPTQAAMPVEQTDAVRQPDPPPAEKATPQRDPLEVAMEARLLLELQRLGCTGVTLDSVTLTSQFTPAAEATSGFDSLYLTGNVSLRADTHTSLIALAGTGKGPGHEIRATDMAARGFARALGAGTMGESCNTLESD